MKGCPCKSGSVTEKLVKVLDEADNNDDRRSCHPNEEEIGQYMHSEMDKSVHTSILPRSGQNGRLTLNALLSTQSHLAWIALRRPPGPAIPYRRAYAAVARRLFMDRTGTAALRPAFRIQL